MPVHLINLIRSDFVQITCLVIRFCSLINTTVSMVMFVPQTGEDVSGESSSEDEESTSRSSSSGRVSPSNSLCRTLGEAPRTTSSRGSTSLKAGYGVKQGAVVSSFICCSLCILGPIWVCRLFCIFYL